MAEQLGEAVLTVSADTRQLEAGLQRAQQQAQQTAQATEQAYTRTGRALQTAANGLQYYIDAQGRARDAGGRFVTQAQLQAAGLEDLAAKSLTAAESLKKLVIELGGLEAGRRVVTFIVDELKQLDAGQAAVRTLGANSAELTTQLRGLSDELKSSVSVNELLKASYDVLSSGFTSATDTTNILRASALGAQGGFTDLATVVKAVTGVVNAYSLSSGNATKVVDQFLQTQNDGVITVGQYAEQIGDVASIAAAAGVSLAEVNAVIAAATLNSIQAPQAFTGLRQALSGILKPTQQATELAASLGLQFNAQALRAKGLTGVLADVQSKTGGAADKLAILFESVEARSVVQVLFNKQLQEYNDLLAKNQQANGAAATAAEINGNTISGNVKKISNAFSNLATTLDSTLNPVFGTLASQTSSVLNTLTKILSLIPKGAGNINGAIAASLLFGPGIGLEVLRGQLGGGAKEPKSSGDSTPRSKPSKTEPLPAGVTVSPAELDFIRKTNALELQGLQDQVAAAKELQVVDGVNAVRIQNRLALEEKLRDVKKTQLDLEREQAKPIGSTGSKAEQDPVKLIQLQNKLQRGQLEITKLRIEQGRSEDEALRRRREQQQTLALELKAFQQGPDAFISPTALLQIKLANMDVREAYASAGKYLKDNAVAAAQALKGAQQGFNSAARGGFQFLTLPEQQRQLQIARASVQTGVDKGLIRTGIDISSPEKLFQVAAFAEQIVPAQKQLENALAENTKATVELTKKDWNVYLGGKPITPPKVPTVSQEPVTFTQRNPLAGAYSIVG